MSTPTSTGPIAYLPMYDWPELRTDINQLWEAIAQRLKAAGISAPSTLTHSGDMLQILQEPNLVIGQTCGAPYRNHLKKKVKVLGSIAYGDWAPGGYYNSVVCVTDAASKRKDYKGLRLAVNSYESQSGYECLEGVIPHNVPLEKFFAERIVTGSHRTSLHKVAIGVADIAAIDSVAWGLAERYDTESVSRVRVIARTKMTPGCPIVTSRWRSPDECEAIVQAIKDALTDLPSECHTNLADSDGLSWADFTAKDYEKTS